jgi:hypothetical protein
MNEQKQRIFNKASDSLTCYLIGEAHYCWQNFATIMNKNNFVFTKQAINENLTVDDILGKVKENFNYHRGSYEGEQNAVQSVLERYFDIKEI